MMAAWERGGEPFSLPLQGRSRAGVDYGRITVPSSRRISGQ